MAIKIISKNKKAYFNYEILDKIEAGVVLTGAEVKAVRNSQINISDAFVRIENEEAWLWNSEISPYKFSQTDDHESRRRRKLLLKKNEIERLRAKIDQKNLTLVPTMVYLARGMIKIEVGLAKGKREYDKKRKLKEREQDRQLHREKRRYMVK